MPRVRGREGEVRLHSCDELHRGGDLDELLFRRVLYGISCRNYEQAAEETLTLHRLGLFARIGRSLKTTNILESVNSQAEEHCGRVDHRQNSNQKQRWLAAALLDIEPRLRRLVRYRHLPALQAAIMKELKLGREEERSRRAA